MGFNLPLLNLRRRLLGSGVSFSPVELFTLSEPGLWLDPSDVANLDWRRNLLTWTEQFDNAAWTKTNVTASSGQLTDDANNGFHCVNQNLSFAEGAYTLQIEAKKGTAQGVFIRVRDSINSGTTHMVVSVDLSNGSQISATGSATITALADGWYRISVSNSVTSGTRSVIVGTVDGGTTSYAGSGKTTLIRKVQLELGSTVTEYQRITDVNTEVIERFPNATLFTDTAGTTPVTTPGQSVALALDKSKGLVLGSELVTNGDFSSGTTGWTPQDGNVVLSTSSGVGVATYSATSSFYQGVSVQAGRTYRATAIIRRASGSGTPFMNFRSGTTLASGVLGELATSGYTSSSFVFASAWFVAASTTTVYLHFPCTAAASTVVEVDNISVKELPGFHATQATAGSRPIYGIVPVGGRRNLLERTEELTNAYYTKTNITLGSGVSDPNGGTAAFTLTSTAANATISRSIGSLATGGTISCFVRRRTGSGAVALWNGTGYSNVTVTGSWARVSVSQVTTTTGYFDMRLAVSGDAVDVAFPQVETESLSNYQRVVSQYDVTEAGVSSLSYLAFDGVDDFLVTPTITPGIDKVTVGAGVRKLSDSTSSGLIAELGTDVNSANGSFALRSPANTALGRSAAFFSRGTTLQGATSGDTLTAPITSVITGLGDISGDLVTLRVNGAQVAQNTSDQGTGNYLAYAMYIGRRAGTSLPFNGQLYSLVVRFAATDVTTVGQLETWINGKTGAYS